MTDACVFCKRPTEGGERIELASDEYLCRSCHRDLRTFKSALPVHLWATPATRPSIEDALAEQYDHRRSALGAAIVEYDDLPVLPSRLAAEGTAED